MKQNVLRKLFAPRLWQPGTCPREVYEEIKRCLSRASSFYFRIEPRQVGEQSQA